MSYDKSHEVTSITNENKFLIKEKNTEIRVLFDSFFKQWLVSNPLYQADE